MDDIRDLIGRAERIAEQADLSLTTVSRKLLNDGKGLARLKAGGQCTVKTLDAARVRLSALEAEYAAPAARRSALAAARPASAHKPAMTHLDRLEAEAMHIMREVAAEAEKPVMLYSIGKDSAVMLHLALKAFHPARPPFPVMHVDTTWKFREMIKFRDETAKRLGL